MPRPSYLDFDYKNYKWKNTIDYRLNPEKYLVGKGEQGVLICEPYKSEIVKYWRFKNVETAKESSEQIFKMFLEYLDKSDFVGADMARKFLQMGFTRSRRYANYKGGKKYDANNNYELHKLGSGNPEKALSADIFYHRWREAEQHPKYSFMKTEWLRKYG